MITIDNFLELMDGCSAPFKIIINFSAKKINFLKNYMEINVVCNSALILKNAIVNAKEKTLSLDFGGFCVTFNNFKLPKHTQENTLKINFINSVHEVYNTVQLNLKTS